VTNTLILFKEFGYW